EARACRRRRAAASAFRGPSRLHGKKSLRPAGENAGTDRLRFCQQIGTASPVRCSGRSDSTSCSSRTAMPNFPEIETALPEMLDPATQEGSKFDLLSIGIYKAQITDATVSQPQSGDGWGVNLTWQITEGAYERRYVWQHITFQHSSVQATTIGRRQFKDLCVATGVDEQVTDVA